MTLNPANGFPMPPLRYVETMGSIAGQADRFIEALDTTMRGAYDTHIERVGNNIYPILYVDFTLFGGRYTLVEDEAKTHVRAPDLLHYAQLKSCAHVPLGIFVMIAEYAVAPGNGQWRPAVSGYREQLRTALAQLDHVAGMNGFERRACRDILHHSIDFISGILGRNSFTLDEFRAYTTRIDNALLFCASRAGQIQVGAMSAIVTEFRDILDSRWDETYVVISALWTLSQENVHAQIIGHQMTDAHRETHLIVSEAVPTLADAKLLLGRIVGDRIAAQYVFNPQGSTENREDIYSLSTRRDLLSRAAHAALDDRETASLCPHLSAVEQGLGELDSGSQSARADEPGPDPSR